MAGAEPAVKNCNRVSLWIWPTGANGTFVSVTESDFSGTGDEFVKYVADSTQGFILMPAGLKAYLERGVKLT